MRLSIPNEQSLGEFLDSAVNLETHRELRWRRSKDGSWKPLRNQFYPIRVFCIPTQFPSYFPYEISNQCHFLVYDALASNERNEEGNLVLIDCSVMQPTQAHVEESRASSVQFIVQPGALRFGMSL